MVCTRTFSVRTIRRQWYCCVWCVHFKVILLTDPIKCARITVNYFYECASVVWPRLESLSRKKAQRVSFVRLLFTTSIFVVCFFLPRWLSVRSAVPMCGPCIGTLLLSSLLNLFQCWLFFFLFVCFIHIRGLILSLSLSFSLPYGRRVCARVSCTLSVSDLCVLHLLLFGRASSSPCMSP